MSHPSYPNPTIVEAVCEIHFSVTPESPWSSTTPGAFWREIATDYPDIEPIVESGIELRVRPDNTLDQVITEKKRYRFTHTSKTKLVQLSENAISLNHLKPYPGWHHVKAELARLWSQSLKVLQPSLVRRIGLRYINGIQRGHEDELAERWLRETPFLPKQPLQSLPPFSSRVEARLVKSDRAIVSVGLVQRDAPWGFIVLDIDCIREQEMSVEVDVVVAAAEDLHEDAWDIFRSAKTDELEHLLNQAA